MGPEVGARRTVHAVEVRLTQGGDVSCWREGQRRGSGGRWVLAWALAAWFTQLVCAARSWCALHAVCPTVHADEVRCTQLFAGPGRRAASSTCAFDASRSFRSLRNCVYRVPVACSVGQNCVYRTPLACSVSGNCVYHTLVACSVGRNCVHLTPLACSVSGNCVYRTLVACSVGRNCVNRATEVCARTPRPPPPSLP